MDAIVIKKSELIEQIREDFKLWEEMSPDIDEGYFDEEDVQSYLNFLIERYHDEWVVIDDGLLDRASSMKLALLR